MITPSLFEEGCQNRQRPSIYIVFLVNKRFNPERQTDKQINRQTGIHTYTQFSNVSLAQY